MQSERSRWSALASSPWAMALAIAALMAAIVGVSLQRTVLGTGVETDFSSLFAQEALRILSGETLLMQYHPPGYAFVLAIVRLVYDGSWLNSGLWITGVSALAVLVASTATWRRLGGDAAAWGALAALACSIPFMASASVASSDMFFTALVCLLLFLIVAVLRSPKRTALWVACGAMASFVFLTRTNGLVAAAVLALPFLVPRPDADRGRNAGAVTIAFLLPLAAWSLYAQATDSPILPVKNYMNLAVAVFGDGVGSWGDQMNRLHGDVKDTMDVVMHDPPRFVAVIAKNLALTPWYLVRSLTWLPIALLAIPGLVLMLWKRRSPDLWMCLGILAGMALLTGIVDFVPRYYLMFIPAIGAMAGVAFVAALDALRATNSVRLIATTIAFLAAGAVATWSSAQALQRVESGRPLAEYAEAAARLRQLAGPDSVVFSRSASLVLESGLRVHYLQEFADSDALFDALCAHADDPSSVYLYLGSQERIYRGALVASLAAGPPPWLEPVVHGTQTDWTLYRFRPDQSSAASCSSSSAT